MDSVFSVTKFLAFNLASPGCASFHPGIAVQILDIMIHFFSVRREDALYTSLDD